MRNKKQQLQKLKNERGLTLVELLAVIVILGIISTIAFVMIGNVIENSKKDAQIANAQQMIASAKLFEVTGEKSEVDFDADGITLAELQTAGFIEPVTDPWTKEPAVSGKVTKEEGVYFVSLISTDKGLDIGTTTKGISEAELNKGRDSVWPK